MTRFLRVLALSIAALAVACDKSSVPSNWVTVPDRASHDAFFPIATGVHAAAGCNDCHGASDTFKKFDCLTCHDQYPALTQASLDTAHTGLAGYAYTSAACYGCHPRGIGGAPVNHTPNFFPIGTGTAHAAVGCTQCHLNNLVTPNDPTQFGCYVCHSGLASWPHPNPVTIPAGTRFVNVELFIVYTSQSASTTLDYTRPENCLRCHADSQVNTVAGHNSGDLAGNSGHAAAGCLTCHPVMRTDKPFGADFGVTPAIGSGTGCGTCHATQPH